MEQELGREITIAEVQSSVEKHLFDALVKVSA
jgi:hypothetical protein